MLKEHPYQGITLPKRKNRPFVAINMVTSLDGKITNGGTQTPALGSSFDRETMNVLRSRFDAVLTGGNTARQHPYYLGVPERYEKVRLAEGLRAQPLTVILSGSGKLDPASPLFKKAPRKPLVITSKEGAARVPPAAGLEIAAERIDLKWLTNLLYEKYGIERLLVEGGAGVNYQFLQAGLVDRLFFTLTPHLVGSRFDLTMVMGDETFSRQPRITLLSYFAHKNELFLAYGLDWQAGPP